ncbi:uncharacterized protein [Temnothorax longispinosus]|uniref:uncharacterized protein isoform X2 n=1 Tax=Temnothorax longispinosus TaxID=300112 RepID=UPI003A9A5778
MRAHILNVHGISIDDETVTLPDDLKQYYSELPGHKAKCNNCGKAVSFLTNIENLRVHLRRHSTRILSRNKTIIRASRRKRSKLWNYFEELKPSLVKCTTCKKEIQIPYRSRLVSIFRAHLSIKHGIFLNNDTFTLPDDLKQYYSELSGYKAKCNDCGKTMSFLTNITRLRKHLRRHSTRILNRDNKTVMVPRKKRSKLWNYFEKLKPTLVKCATCTKEIKISRLKEIKIMRIHLSRQCDLSGIFLDNDTHTLPDDLKQYYSELPGHKAKCNNCGKAISFVTNKAYLRKHLKKHSTKILSRDETIITAPARKRNKLWNYFEELNPSLVKCTTCKKEIKISHPKNRIIILRTHLFNEHGIYLDDDIRKLPDDLKQYYSKLPGYKAKCNNCGKTVSFLTNIAHLRTHLKRHSTIIQSRDKTVIMAQKRKRSKLWNYFEEVNPSLVKCTTCKKEIKIPYPNNSRTIIFRKHLFNKHKIYLDDDIFSLPDDLKEYYSKLPRYKAKCNNCGKTLSFLSNFKNLRRHVKRHSTSIQSPDEPNTSITTGFDTNPTAECQSQESPGLPVQSFEQTRKETSTLDKTIIKPPTRKRSKLWNYFEELKPSLVKCIKCKEHFHVPNEAKLMRTFRGHLLNVHAIYLDNDTLSLPDDLKQYYSELPGYKAKCNDCGKTLSFLANMAHLREHLKRHSILPTRIQNRDETVMVPKKKRSKLWNYFEELKPTLVKCTTCKKEIKIFHPKHSTKLMRLHLSKHGIFLDNDTFSLQDDLKQYYSELSGYKAKCNDCGKTYSFIRNPTYLREHLKRRHSTKIQSQDEPSTSSLPNTMDPSAERQGQDISDLPVQSFKEKAGALNVPNTSITTGFDTNPTAECRSQESPGLPVQSFEQTRKETSTLDK